MTYVLITGFDEVLERFIIKRNLPCRKRDCETLVNF